MAKCNAYNFGVLVLHLLLSVSGSSLLALFADLLHLAGGVGCDETLEAHEQVRVQVGRLLRWQDQK